MDTRYIETDALVCAVEWHEGRHAWEPAWVERVAEIERQVAADIPVILRAFAEEMEEEADDDEN